VGEGKEGRGEEMAEETGTGKEGGEEKCGDGRSTS